MAKKTASKKPAAKRKADDKTKGTPSLDKTMAEASADDLQEEKLGLFMDPGEIMDAVKVVASDMESLRTRFEDDFDLYKLDPYESKEGYESYTSSAPKNFFDKIQDGVNRAALTIHVNTGEDAQEDERADANDAELFLIGALNDIDRLGRKGRRKALRRQLAFMSCLRGWVVVRALVYVPEGEKDTRFDVRVWDPMHVYWEDGMDGQTWVAHQRKATKSQIWSEYGYMIEGKDALITDFWTETHNSVLVDSEWIKEPTEHHVENGIPIFIGNVGDMPDIQTKDFSGSGSTAGTYNTLEYQGESVWAAARGVIEPRNRYISQLMDVAKRSVAGSLVHQSKNGDKKIKGDPYASFQAIPVEEGESITPLELPSAPPETAAILGVLDHDWQQSTLPYPLAYGGTQAAESGRALAIRIEATRSAYSPRTHLLREVYLWLSEQLLSQYANQKKGNKAVELHGDNPMTDEFFRVTLEPKEIKPDWIVDVIVEPRLPRDEEVEINMALAATSDRGGKQPLLSTMSGRKDILKLKNPDLEEQRVLVEMGKSIEPIMYRRIAEATANSGDEEGAKAIMTWIEANELKAANEVAAAKGEPPIGQAPDGAEEPAPPNEEELEIIEAVINALVEYGEEELAQELADALGGGQARDGLMDEVIAVLQANGAGDLAQALVQALGGGQSQQTA